MTFDCAPVSMLVPTHYYLLFKTQLPDQRFFVVEISACLMDVVLFKLIKHRASLFVKVSIKDTSKSRQLLYFLQRDHSN